MGYPSRNVCELFGNESFMNFISLSPWKLMYKYKEKPYSFGFKDRVNLKIFSSLDVLLES